MDPHRFDSLSRELSRARSRRGAMAATFGGTLALLGLAQTTARHKKHKKKHGGASPPPPPVSPPSPSPNECATLFEGAFCGGRGCKVCRSGVCVVEASRERADCGNDGCLVCLNGVCSTNPNNDDPCGAGGGRCYFGECNPAPTCQGASLGNCAVIAPCCSGRCSDSGVTCAQGGAGVPCRAADDCTSRNCVGYRCQ